MADKGGIQLLPETRKKIEVKVPGENRMLTIGASALILVLVLFGVATAMTRQLETQIKEQNKKLAAMNQSRDKDMEKKLIALDKQSTLITQFLKSHVFWTQALSNIEKVLQQQVQFTSLAADLTKKEVSFNALAPNYSAIARQIASFVADDGIKDVYISRAKSANDGRFEFDVRILFDESKYLRRE